MIDLAALGTTEQFDESTQLLPAIPIWTSRWMALPVMVECRSEEKEKPVAAGRSGKAAKAASSDRSFSKLGAFRSSCDHRCCVVLAVVGGSQQQRVRLASWVWS